MLYKYDNSIHNDSQVQRIRDVLAGSDQVKRRGVEYLPMLSEQTTDEYSAYQLRGNFLNLSAKVLSSLVGQVTRKPPVLEGHEPYFDVATNYGENAVELTGVMAEELLSVSRMGLLVDYFTENDRPYIVKYLAESIDDVIWDPLKAQLQSVTLQEEISDTETISKTLFLDDKGFYAVDDGSGTIKYPTKNGKKLNFIPFIVFNDKKISPTVTKPLLIDVVDVNLSWWRTSCDLENGLHFVGLPTPVVSGVADFTLKVGTTTGLVLPDDKAKAYYMEFQGQGLSALSDSLKDKQSQIAMFSARLIDSNTSGSQSAESTRLRFSSEASALVTTATVIGNVLTQCYEWMYWWGDVNDEVKIRMPLDFLSLKLTAAEITALTDAYLQNAITRDTYVNNLHRGDIVRPDRIEEEKVEILKRDENGALIVDSGKTSTDSNRKGEMSEQGRKNDGFNDFNSEKV